MDDIEARARARFERARARHVIFGTPMARHPTRQFTFSMIRTAEYLTAHGVKFGLAWVNGSSNLAAARNEIAATFMASDATDLIWVDDDMGWDPVDVMRLLANENDFVGAVGRKKVANSDPKDIRSWCVYWTPGWPIESDDMGAIAVPGLGTGFLKTTRRVFEEVGRARPELKRDGPDSMPDDVRAQYHSFFSWKDDNELCLSEDIHFCHIWRQLGGKVWADPSINLIHVGETEFSGAFATLFKAAA